MKLLGKLIQSSNAGMALEAISGVANVLGLGSNATKEQVVERMNNATPEEVEKLTELEAHVAERTMELALENTKDARENYVKNRDYIAGMTAGTVAITFMGSVAAIMVFAFMKIEIPGNMEVLLSTIIGHISGMMSNKVNFFWGASNAEAKK